MLCSCSATHPLPLYVQRRAFNQGCRPRISDGSGFQNFKISCIGCRFSEQQSTIKQTLYAEGTLYQRHYVASTSTKIYPRKSTSKIWRNWWGTKSTVWNHLRVRWAWEPAKAAARRMWRLWLPKSLRRLSMQLRSWKLSLGALSRSGTLGNLLHLSDWFLAPTLVNPQLIWTYSWIGWWFGWSPPIIKPLSHLLAESFRWTRWLSSTEAFPGRPG